MTNNTLDTLNLTGLAAAKAFLASYYANEAKDLMTAVCTKLDETYAPQHVYKADEFEIDSDLEVTYVMFNTVDDTADLVACDLEHDEEDIADDETLAEYIERKLDGRMCALPTYKEQVHNEAAAYGPEDFYKKFPRLQNG